MCVCVVHKLHFEVYPAVCVCLHCAQTTLVGWGGIISAGGPALPAFQRGISVADADDNPDVDACDD